MADGYQLCTRHEFNDRIRKFLKLDRSSRLSQPSLDTLSIIAYKQPLTRQEVDEIRGVDSSGVIKTLLEKKYFKFDGLNLTWETLEGIVKHNGPINKNKLPR